MARSSTRSLSTSVCGRSERRKKTPWLVPPRMYVAIIRFCFIVIQSCRHYERDGRSTSVAPIYYLLCYIVFSADKKQSFFAIRLEYPEDLMKQSPSCRHLRSLRFTAVLLMGTLAGWSQATPTHNGLAISRPPVAAPDCKARVGSDRNDGLPGYLLPTSSGPATCIPFTSARFKPPAG